MFDLTSVYFQNMIKLLFHHKDYFLNFSYLELSFRPFLNYTYLF